MGTNETAATAAEVSTELELIPAEATLEEVIAAVNALTEKVNGIKVRDRGPQSEKAMTEELARQILLEEPFCRLSHKKTAEKLGLSYGQVSSVRGGYTFKKQYKEWRDLGSKKTWDRDFAE
tara:strand:+ start:288 stop:650 length:363 start_codon:yes stop_codon:yes gene_type:complete